MKRETTIGGTSETTVYVYDAFGRLAAEYSSVAPVVGSGGTFYRTEDHLGSTRLVTKQDQTVAECRDFFPFGERIGSGLNGRSLTCYGGTGDVLAQQFTGKERDKESSLDYFGARYYSARLGRFVSLDAPFVDQFASAPQSWSLYSYARNNPLRFLDPTGRRCVKTDDGSVGDDGEGEMCQAVVKDGPQQETVYAYPQISPAAAQIFRSAAFRAEDTFRAFATVSLAAGAAAGGALALAASGAGLTTIGGTVAGPVVPLLPQLQTVVQRSYPALGNGLRNLQLSKHAVQRMAQRGITREMIQETIEKCTRYWDPLHKNFRYILRDRFARGKGVSISIDPVTNEVITVFKVSKTPSRLIPF